MRPTPTDAVDADTDTDTDLETGIATETLQAPVPETLAGRRFDQALAEMFPEFSRSRLTEWIKSGAALLDGAQARPRDPVHDGQQVTLVVERTVETTAEAEAIPISILYEDADVLVIDKPAGLVVHPGAGNWTGTLVNALIHHCGDSLSGIGGVKRPGIVHRLDKDTSGVMVVAKNDAAHRHLSDQFADHGRNGPLERAYRAVVWGRPRQLKGKIDAPLGRAGDRTKRAVKREDSDDAREAITHYEVVERYHEKPDGTSLASTVECHLETGRTHQIRVHMAHIGHPLIGDPDYGAAFRTKANLLPEPARAAVNRFPRQALHAFMLQFEHPATGETMHFETPVPADIQELIAALRVGAP